MNVLLDECLPARLTRFLTEHAVTTVPRRGWTGFKNGELLRLAENEFDAFVTVDRKISSQQDVTKFNIAVVLIRARSNRLEDIRPLVPELLATLKRAPARTLTSIGEL